MVLASLSSALNHLKSSVGGSSGLSGAPSNSLGVVGMESSASSSASTTVDGSNFIKSFASYPPPSSTLTHHPRKGQQASSASSMSKSAGASGSQHSSKKQQHQGKSKKGGDKASKDANPAAAITNYNAPLSHPVLKQILDPIIDLNDCEVFSYTPDLDSDPHAYQSEDEEEEDEDGFGEDDDSDFGRRQYEDDLDEMDMVMDRDRGGEDDDMEGVPKYKNRYISGLSRPDVRRNRTEEDENEVGWEMDGVASSSSKLDSSVPDTETPGGTPASSRNYVDGSEPGTPVATRGNPFSLDYAAKQQRRAARGRGSSLSSRINGGRLTDQRLFIDGSGNITTADLNKLSPEAHPGSLSLPRDHSNPSHGPRATFGSLNSSYTSQSSYLSSRRFSPDEGMEHSPVGRQAELMDGDDSGLLEDEDDETGGLLWSSNYFFYNKKLKRILFITCWGRKVGSTLPVLLNPVVERFTANQSRGRGIGGVGGFGGFGFEEGHRRGSITGGVGTSSPGSGPGTLAGRSPAQVYGSLGEAGDKFLSSDGPASVKKDSTLLKAADEGGATSNARPPIPHSVSMNRLISDPEVTALNANAGSLPSGKDSIFSSIGTPAIASSTTVQPDSPPRIKETPLSPRPVRSTPGPAAPTLLSNTPKGTPPTSGVRRTSSRTNTPVAGGTAGAPSTPPGSTGGEGGRATKRRAPSAPSSASRGISSRRKKNSSK